MAPLISLGGMKMSSCHCRQRAGRRDWGGQSRSRRGADRAGRRPGCRGVVRRRGGPCGNAPVLAIELDQLAARREAGQLLQQQAAFPAAGQAELAHQLLVSGFLAGGAADARHQFPIGHISRVGQTAWRERKPLEIRAMQIVTNRRCDLMQAASVPDKMRVAAPREQGGLRIVLSHPFAGKKRKDGAPGILDQPEPERNVQA